MITPQLDFKESQNKTVLKHLVKFGSITANEAVRIYGIYRLSARINDLRAKGVSITSTLAFNPSNRSNHWSIYTFKN